MAFMRWKNENENVVIFAGKWLISKLFLINGHGHRHVKHLGLSEFSVFQ